MKKIIVALALVAGILEAQTAKTILIFGGKTGYIGQKLAHLFSEQGHNVVCATSRLENREEVNLEILATQPDRIINAAGITGRPNIDWCETHKQETIRANILGALNLADFAYVYNIHLTYIGTGCIYEYDEKHPMAGGIGFTEEEAPNFNGSFYSQGKIALEKFQTSYPNILNLRIKMPISKELDKGFIGKITKYKKLVNIPNSMSILEDILPLVVDMSLRELTGIFNMVNPGTLSHNQVLDLYKKYINPQFTYENFTLEEQAKILIARRANAELSANKLLSLYPNIPSAHNSLEALLKKIASQAAEKKLTTQTLL